MNAAMNGAPDSLLILFLVHCCGLKKLKALRLQPLISQATSFVLAGMPLHKAEVGARSTQVSSCLCQLPSSIIELHLIISKDWIQLQDYNV